MIILKTIFQIISKFFRAARNSQFNFFIEKNEKKYEAKAVFFYFLNFLSTTKKFRKLLW